MFVKCVWLYCIICIISIEILVINIEIYFMQIKHGNNGDLIICYKKCVDLLTLCTN